MLILKRQGHGQIAVILATNNPISVGYMKNKIYLVELFKER